MFLVSGGRRLCGELEVGCAKNAVLPILAAAMLTDTPVTVEDCPNLVDARNMLSILETLGCRVERRGREVRLDASRAENHEMPEKLSKRLRSSIFMLGPLVARFGRARVSYPGGCEIGQRPIDLHLKGLRALGVQIRETHGMIECEGARLRGADVYLDFPSVGATENVMMAAVLARGKTTIHNAAREPEVADLIGFLNKMGAKIDGAGCGIITIEGVEKLHGAQHRIMPDRIEAGTLMVASAISEGDILLKGIGMQEMAAVSAKLSAAGARIQTERNGIRIRAKGRPRATDIRTMPYPGFPTDMQPQFMALMARAEGASVISETIFENRFRHVPEMRRMNADIRVIGDSAIVYGREHICGACVETPDLRAGAALVLLALAADGRTVIEQIHYIDRGYQNLEYSLSALGASIQRETAEAETEMAELPRRAPGELVPAEISQF